MLLNWSVSLLPISPSTVFEPSWEFQINGSFSHLEIYSESLGPSPKGASSMAYRIGRYLDLVLVPGHPGRSFNVSESQMPSNTRASNSYLLSALLQKTSWDSEAGEGQVHRVEMPLVLHTLIEGALTVFSAMHRCCDSAKELKTTWPTSQSGSDQGLGYNTKGTRESSDQEVSVPRRDASFCTLQRDVTGRKKGPPHRGCDPQWDSAPCFPSYKDHRTPPHLSSTFSLGTTKMDSQHTHFFLKTEMEKQTHFGLNMFA